MMPPIPQLKEQLRKALECPVCSDTMERTTVRVCPNGHAFCNECRAKMLQCPICRNSNIDGRCIIVEDIANFFSGSPISSVNVSCQTNASNFPGVGLQGTTRRSRMRAGQRESQATTSRSTRRSGQLESQATTRRSTMRAGQRESQATTSRSTMRAGQRESQATTSRSTMRAGQRESQATTSRSTMRAGQRESQATTSRSTMRAGQRESQSTTRRSTMRAGQRESQATTRRSARAAVERDARVTSRRSTRSPVERDNRAPTRRSARRLVERDNLATPRRPPRSPMERNFGFASLRSSPLIIDDPLILQRINNRFPRIAIQPLALSNSQATVRSCERQLPNSGRETHQERTSGTTIRSTQAVMEHGSTRNNSASTRGRAVVATEPLDNTARIAAYRRVVPGVRNLSGPPRRSLRLAGLRSPRMPRRSATNASNMISQLYSQGVV